MAKKRSFNEMCELMKLEESSKPNARANYYRCKILIVSQGEKTEPNYFESFKKNGRDHIDIDFEHRCGDPKQVVDKAIFLKEKAAGDTRSKYDRVWAVFDKDDFELDCFNQAILQAASSGIDCAWSNEAFELWYLLHFDYHNSGIDRSSYIDRINKNVRRNSKNRTFKYKKNATDTYDVLKTCGNMEIAIANAKRLFDSYEGRQQYANHNPCTTVHRLVEQLLRRDPVLENELKSKIED